MSSFVETWKGIATALGRSERWCRYMARRGGDPLPVFKLGGIVRLNCGDLEDWLGRQRDRSVRTSARGGGHGHGGGGSDTGMAAVAATPVTPVAVAAEESGLRLIA